MELEKGIQMNRLFPILSKGELHCQIQLNNFFIKDIII